MFVITAVIGAPLIVVCAVVMWLFEKYVHKLLSLVFGALAFVFLSQSMVRGILHCAAPGKFIPPTTEESAAGSEGRMFHNCDAPWGALDRLYPFGIAPLMLICLGFLVCKYWNKDIAA